MKKNLFKALLVIATVLIFASPCLAKKKVIKWKVQGFVPAGMLYHDTLVRLADKVKKATGGRLIFEVHPAGALVPPFEGIKAVSHGAYQAQYSYSAMWVGKIPVSPLFTASPGGLNTLGIWEVCKYVMLPGIHQPASQTELIINKEAYAALPDDLKSALKAAVNQSRLDEWLWMEQKNIEAVKFLKEKGITWVTMDPKTVSTMQKWATEYLDKRASKDKNFAKVWNSIQKFGEQWYPYHKLYSLPH